MEQLADDDVTHVQGCWGYSWGEMVRCVMLPACKGEATEHVLLQ